MTSDRYSSPDPGTCEHYLIGERKEIRLCAVLKLEQLWWDIILDHREWSLPQSWTYL